MKILIVDDEKRARTAIRDVVQLYAPQVTEIEEADGVKSAVDAVRDSKPDLILLDIRLKDGNGFDVLKHIGSMEIPVIFITAYEDYAIQAFKVSAVDYLLKPIDPDDFSRAISRAVDIIEKEKFADKVSLFLQNMQAGKPQDMKLALKTAESIHIVPVSDIVFCEASNNYTTFYLQDKRKILVSKSLGEYEDMLPQDLFLRVHQSYLIQTKYILRYDKGDGGFLVMTGDHQVPVSTRKKEYVMQYLQRLG